MGGQRTPSQTPLLIRSDRLKTESPEHLKPRSQYAEDAVQLAIAGKWDEAVKLNRFIVDNFGADEETQNRLGKALSELGKLKEAKMDLANPDADAAKKFAGAPKIAVATVTDAGGPQSLET